MVLDIMSDSYVLLSLFLLLCWCVINILTENWMHCVPSGFKKRAQLFLKSPTQWFFLAFLGFIGFFGQAGKIGKIIQKLSNLKT